MKVYIINLFDRVYGYSYTLPQGYLDCEKAKKEVEKIRKISENKNISIKIECIEIEENE